jgi:hypothetical protein
MQTRATTTCGLFGRGHPAAVARPRPAAIKPATIDEYFPAEGEPGYFLDLDHARAHLAALLDDLPADATAAPLISAVEIDGEKPSYDQVAAIEAELRKVPAAIVSPWQATGGRIEIAAGRQANRHPGRPPALRNQRCDGWYWHHCRLIVVAAKAPPETVIHELGHAFDGSGRFSSLPAWRTICRFRAENPVRFNLAEFFAEDFKDYLFSPTTRTDLPPEVRKFIEEAAGVGFSLPAAFPISSKL